MDCVISCILTWEGEHRATDPQLPTDVKQWPCVILLIKLQTVYACMHKMVQTVIHIAAYFVT